MYAFVAAATGWTWEYIGQCLTLPRLFAMHAIWRKYPPLIVAAASLLGVKDGSPPKKLLTQADIAKAMTADPRKLRWITVPNEARNG